MDKPSEIEQEFDEKYDNRRSWLQRAGLHSQEQVPEDTEQRLYFALLEALDFQCWKFKDAPLGITEEQAKEFLSKHKDKIKCPPPSYIGLLSGVFDFIAPQQSKEKCS